MRVARSTKSDCFHAEGGSRERTHSTSTLCTPLTVTPRASALSIESREMCREVVTFLRHLQPFFSDKRDQKQPSGAESGSITAPLSLPFVLVDERYSTAEALEPMYEMTRRSARGGAGRAFRRLSSRSTSSSPPKQTPPGVAPAYSAALHGKESHRRDSHAAATILQRVLDAAPDLSTLAVDDDDVSDDMP